MPLRFAVIVLGLLGAWAIQPLWAPLVLALWTAILVQPLYARLVKALAGKARAAGAITVLIVLLILCPLAALGISVVSAAAELVQKLQHSKEASEAFGSILPSDAKLSFDKLRGGGLLDFARQHGASAVNALRTTFSALAAAIIGLVIYVFGVHAALVDGPRAHAWLLARMPVSRSAVVRLGNAFAETGRGLFVGIGVTALLQGFVTTIGYVVVGVPQALLLGFLTTMGALIPSVGTAIVWAPVTVVLFATGKTAGAIVLLVIGCVASVVDNFVRPWLSRYGKLTLPTFVVFVAMLGGIAAFGGFGLLLGPLFVRLAVEALDIWRDQKSPRSA